MNARPVALVTGASRGIGAATAPEFARRGNDLVLVARTADGLEATASAVRAAGGEALVIAGDLSDLAFAETLVGRAVAHFGRLDVLVNNAAWRDLRTMRTIPIESWERTIRVNLTVPAFLSRWAAEQMERQRGSASAAGGVIVNVSSIQSRRAAGISPAYVAAKGGLDILTAELATVYGPAGIRVVAINPGAIDTEMNADYNDPSGASLSAQTLAHVEDMVPLRRVGRPEEIARAIAWLASPEASYVTGTTIVVDGGWSGQHAPYALKRMMFPDEFR